jgi:hypothetical protein
MRALTLLLLALGTVNARADEFWKNTFDLPNRPLTAEENSRMSREFDRYAVSMTAQLNLQGNAPEQATLAYARSLIIDYRSKDGRYFAQPGEMESYMLSVNAFRKVMQSKQDFMQGNWKLDEIYFKAKDELAGAIEEGGKVGGKAAAGKALGALTRLGGHMALKKVESEIAKGIQLREQFDYDLETHRDWTVSANASDLSDIAFHDAKAAAALNSLMGATIGGRFNDSYLALRLGNAKFRAEEEGKELRKTVENIASGVATTNEVLGAIGKRVGQIKNTTDATLALAVADLRDKEAARRLQARLDTHRFDMAELRGQYLLAGAAANILLKDPKLAQGIQIAGEAHALIKDTIFNRDSLGTWAMGGNYVMAAQLLMSIPSIGNPSAEQMMMGQLAQIMEMIQTLTTIVIQDFNHIDRVLSTNFRRIQIRLDQISRDGTLLRRNDDELRDLMQSVSARALVAIEQANWQDYRRSLVPSLASLKYKSDLPSYDTALTLISEYTQSNTFGAFQAGAQPLQSISAGSAGSPFEQSLPAVTDGWRRYAKDVPSIDAILRPTVYRDESRLFMRIAQAYPKLTSTIQTPNFGILRDRGREQIGFYRGLLIVPAQPGAPMHLRKAELAAAIADWALGAKAVAASTDSLASTAFLDKQPELEKFHPGRTASQPFPPDLFVPTEIRYCNGARVGLASISKKRPLPAPKFWPTYAVGQAFGISTKSKLAAPKDMHALVPNEYLWAQRHGLGELDFCFENFTVENLDLTPRRGSDLTSADYKVIMRVQFTPVDTFEELAKNIPPQIAVKDEPGRAGKSFVVSRYQAGASLRDALKVSWKVLTSGLAWNFDDVVWSGATIDGGYSTCHHPKRPGYCWLRLPKLSEQFVDAKVDALSDAERAAIEGTSAIVRTKIADLHRNWKTSEKLAKEETTGMNRDVVDQTEGILRMLQALTSVSLYSQMQSTGQAVFDPDQGLVGAEYFVSLVAFDGKSVEDISAEVDRRAQSALAAYDSMDKSTTLEGTRTAIDDLLPFINFYDFLDHRATFRVDPVRH